MDECCDSGFFQHTLHLLSSCICSVCVSVCVVTVDCNGLEFVLSSFVGPRSKFWVMTLDEWQLVSVRRKAMNVSSCLSLTNYNNSICFSRALTIRCIMKAIVKPCSLIIFHLLCREFLLYKVINMLHWKTDHFLEACRINYESLTTTKYSGELMKVWIF